VTSDADRTLLLKIARDAIAAHVNPQSAIESAINNLPSAILKRPGAAFVTIHKRGDLRGCIGHLAMTEPLGTVVPRCAVAAAATDPRFPALTADEIADIDLEISLLGPLEPIAGPQDIVVGRHGLVVDEGWHRGLLLPQVAVEWGWDAATFLAHTCQKAGLPKDAWRHGAKLSRFEAEVFAER
jgi:AmmeMemoRadiSam system protein A